MTNSEAVVFAGLYERYYRHVFAYCRRRSDADAVDDLVSEVYLAAWRKIANAPDGEDALKWLYRIAYLVMTNHWRGTSRRKKLDEKLESIGVQPVPLVSDQVVVREEVRELLGAAQRLRERDVEVLRLSLWEHLSIEEIAVVLGINPNAAKQRLHRARRNLAKEYEKTLNRRSVSPAAQEGGEW